MKQKSNKFTINIHGNPVSPNVMQLFTVNSEENIPPKEITIPTPVNPVFHPNHPHDGYINAIQHDNTQLRAQCITSQSMISDLQSQINSSAMKIIEFEQEIDRNKFRYAQLTEELLSSKLHCSQLIDEQVLLKHSITNERQEMNDSVKQIQKQMDIMKNTHQSDLESLNNKLRSAEVSE